jgi:ABC-type transport system substrate-binding protein
VSLVGNGPLEIKKWVAHESIEAEALANHWRVVPRVAQYQWVEIKEVSAMIAAFKAGDVHLAPIPLKFVNDPVKARNGQVKTISAEWGQSVTFGGNFWADKIPETGEAVPPRPGFKPDDVHPWLGDPKDPVSMERARKVRLALGLAIDRDKINRTILGGNGLVNVIDFALPQTHPLFNKEWVQGYDPARAKQLLAEAGYPNGFEIPDFYITADLPALVDVEVGQAVVQMWRDNLNVKATISSINYNAHRPTLITRAKEYPWMWVDRNVVTPFWNTSLGDDMVPTVAPAFNKGIELPWEVSQYFKANLEGGTDLDKEARIANNVKVQDFLRKWTLTWPIVGIPSVFAVAPEIREWRPYVTIARFSHPESIVLR